MAIDYGDWVMECFMGVLPEGARLDAGTAKLIMNRLREYIKDPLSVPPEWWGPLIALQNFHRDNAPPLEWRQPPRVTYLINPKDDEAFRLFSDAFYDEA